MPQTLRTVRTVVVAVVFSVGLAVAPVHVAGAQTAPALVDVRAAPGAGFDRVVFEFSNRVPTDIDVQAVPVVVSDPASFIVPIAGQARLRVRFGLIDWFFPPPGGSFATRNVAEVRLADAFEGIVHYGIGLRWNASYRVFTLSGPPRVVVDIDHTALPTVSPTAGTVYAVDAAGALRWFRHADPEGGSYQWSLANFGSQIGNGFGALARLVPGGDGVLYGVDAQGNLRWYRHADPIGGSAQWVVPNFGAVVGTGWGGMRDIVADGYGDVYAVRNDGTLLAFRHTGRADGTFNWGAGSGTAVGSGFDACTKLFAGGPGILYCVRADGQLQWWRHIGAPESVDGWAGGNIVGTGWNRFRQLWAGGQGVIYGVDDTGNLRWYRHLGSETGSSEWQVAGFGNVIGDGWGAFPALRTGGLHAG